MVYEICGTSGKGYAYHNIKNQHFQKFKLLDLYNKENIIQICMWMVVV